MTKGIVVMLNCNIRFYTAILGGIPFDQAATKLTGSLATETKHESITSTSSRRVPGMEDEQEEEDSVKHGAKADSDESLEPIVEVEEAPTKAQAQFDSCIARCVNLQNA